MGLQRLLVETWNSREILVKVQGKKNTGAVEKTYFVLEDTYVIMSLEMQMLKELLMRFQLEMRKMLLQSGAEEISK